MPDPVVVAEPGTAPIAASAAAVADAVAPEWVTALADETLRVDKTLGKYPTSEAAHKGHVELQKAYGAKVEGMVKLPPKDSKLDSPETKAYREAVGIPLALEGYKDVAIPKTQGQPTMMPEGVKAFTENVAFPAGMTVDQVQRSINFLAEHNAQQQLEFRQGLVSRQEDLRKEWGANFEREVGMASRAIPMVEKDAGMSPQLFQMIEGMGLNEHPDYIRMFAWVARNLFEQGLVPGHVEGSLTKDELLAKKDAMQKDPRYSLAHPEHAAFQEEYDAVYKALYPGPAQT